MSTVAEPVTFGGADVRVQGAGTHAFMSTVSLTL